MVTQFVQNPVGILFPGGATPGGEIMSLQLPRLTKLEAGKLSLAHKSSFDIGQEVDSTSSERSPKMQYKMSQHRVCQEHRRRMLLGCRSSTLPLFLQTGGQHTMLCKIAVMITELQS